MNEKICSNCGKHNPADMSFCLDCGQSLAFSGGGQNFPVESAPTVFTGRATQPNTLPNFQPLTPQISPPPKKSRTGFYLAIFGGIGLIFILMAAGVMGLVLMNWRKSGGDDKANLNSRTKNVNVAVANSNSARENQNTAETDDSLSSDDSSSNSDNSSNTSDSSPSAPSATLNEIRADYDVTEGGRDGMRIHVDFTVNKLKGVDSYLAIYFETRDGKRLPDKNKKFYSADGTAAVYKELKPGFDETDYKDMTVFMPYDELDLQSGKYELRMDADVIYKAGGLVQHLGYHEFDYTEK